MRHTKNTYLTDLATATDLLRYEDFQSALYDILTQAETPLTVVVFGPWGSGKTSLMKMLHQQMEGEGLASRRTVWFTAWKYDRQDALWRAFILRVLDALYPRENEPKERPRVERPVLENPGPREARTDIFFYIEAFYNRQRRHSTLGYVSPAAHEAAYYQHQLALT